VQKPIFLLTKILKYNILTISSHFFQTLNFTVMAEKKSEKNREEKNESVKTKKVQESSQKTEEKPKNKNWKKDFSVKVGW